MNKKWLEISISTGLVLLMVALILIVQSTFPTELKSTGFVLVVLFYIVAMGFAGIRLIDM